MQETNSVVKNIARNIRSRRKELKMTQSELADLLGYSAKAVSKWESGAGAPPTVILPNLAQVLQTNLDTLMGDVCKPLCADEPARFLRNNAAPAQA